jgi:beta-glucosidase/6-phospho-beta-glucosidase/beta-galactosidase
MRTANGGAVARRRLPALRAPEAFVWATGIEDTFVVDPWPATGRTLDEYELTDHYRQWRSDLGRMAELGVRAARYGIPWYRVSPKRGRWNWRWADGPLERMLDLGIDPIVDLVHYGTPGWIEGGFLAPEFPEYMAEYAARVAERFRGRNLWYSGA